MDDMQRSAKPNSGQLPTLSEILSHEMETRADSLETTDEESPRATALIDDDINVSMGLPAGIALMLDFTSFSEPVQEEVEWIIGEDALLPLATRNHLIVAAMRALELRRVTATDDETDNAWQEQLAQLAESPGDRLRSAEGLTKILESIEGGRIRATKFSPSAVAGLTKEADVDPVVSFAVFSRAIRRRSEQSSLRRIPILAGNSDESWDDWLNELRRLLLLVVDDEPADMGN